MKYYDLNRSFAAAVLIFLLTSIANSTGTLDPNFGNGGKASFRFSGTSSDGRPGDALLQPDGKIVIVGTSGMNGQSSGFNRFALARLNANGTIDSNFGASGWVVTDFSPQQDERANSVALQPDGKIVVGGYVGSVFAVARFNSDGGLDTTFSGGLVTTDFPASGSESIFEIRVLTDGKILAAGSCACGSGARWVAVARYNSNGTPDDSFGTNGRASFPVPGAENLRDVMLQADGRIVTTASYMAPIPGCIPTKGNSCTILRTFLMRFDNGLRLERKFGRSFGSEYSPTGDPVRAFLSTASLPDGDMFVITQQNLRRYAANGRLEAIFGLIPVPFDMMVEYAVELPDGKVAGCGTTHGGNGWDDIGVALFASSGNLLATDKRDFFTGNDVCSDILVQPDGKLVVIGATQIEQQGAYSFAALR